MKHPARHPERVADSAAAASSFSPSGVSPWKIWVPVLIVFLALDLGFNSYFWRIPKLSISEADFGYQFALDEQLALQSKPAGTHRVLAFGSSVAGAFDAHQVETLLQARGDTSIEVVRLMLPGMHQFEYSLLFDSVNVPAPDVVVILFNLVDFLYPATNREVNPTLRYVLPAEAAERAGAGTASWSDWLEMRVARVSNLYRYRKLVRSAVQDHLRALGRWLRSSRQAGTYGVYADGYTERRFAVPFAPTFEYFVDPEWIHQRGIVQLDFRVDGTSLEQRLEREPGWKSISLPTRAGAKTLEVFADSVWNPRAGGQGDDIRLLGVRLKEIPPLPAKPAAPFRYQLSEEGDVTPYLRMAGKRGEQFERAWQEVMEANTRFGQRFRLYREAELALREKPFAVDADFVAIQALVQKFRAQGSKVILISTPLTPHILKDIEGSAYFGGYRAFFRSLANSPDVAFQDLSARMPAEDFNDLHHVNYMGAIKLGLFFADQIQAMLPKTPNHGEQEP